MSYYNLCAFIFLVQIKLAVSIGCLYNSVRLTDSGILMSRVCSLLILSAAAQKSRMNLQNEKGRTFNKNNLKTRLRCATAEKERTAPTPPQPSQEKQSRDSCLRGCVRVVACP